MQNLKVKMLSVAMAALTAAIDGIPQTTETYEVSVTFQIANPIESSIIETGKRSDGKVFLLENGMLSMTLTDGENKTTLYMTKEPEE